MFGPNYLLTLIAVSTGFFDNVKCWLDEFSDNIKYCLDWIFCWPLQSVWTEFSDISIKYCLDRFLQITIGTVYIEFSLLVEWILW